jgi:hypothetical protein
MKDEREVAEDLRRGNEVEQEVDVDSVACLAFQFRFLALKSRLTASDRILRVKPRGRSHVNANTKGSRKFISE